MWKELKYALRLSEHLKDVTARYFEIRSPYTLQAFEEYNDQTYRAYIRDVVVDRPGYSEFTQDQKYLHDLGGLIGPILSAQRIKGRVPRLKPRTYHITASERLEECGRLLAMDAFHFKERIRLFGKSGSSIIIKLDQRIEFQNEIGRIVRNYNQATKRLMKYRNFVVHGPDGRIDEFADLRGWELSGLLLHNDLWLDYNNEFETCRSEWTLLAKQLIRAMERAAAEIQLLNENFISVAAFGFVSTGTIRYRASQPASADHLTPVPPHR
jgi:hypothetical protein